MLIHGFWLVNARLLMAFGTAFYAITEVLHMHRSMHMHCAYTSCYAL